MRTGETTQFFSQYPTTFLTLDGMKRRLPIAKAPTLLRLCPYRFYSSRAKDAAAPISTPQASPDTNVDSPSVKPRKWGNRALPLSPIMDPVKIEQRNRHRKTKLPPPKNADLTPFQKALVNNPYARALATDIRHCNITDAHLPSFFQIPFEVLPHIDPPHQFYLVPTRLFADVTPNVSYKKTGASNYAQCRQSVLKHVLEEKIHTALINHSQREDMGETKNNKSPRFRQRSGVRWRQDMDEFVLGLLQSAVVRSLKWGLQHPKAGLVTRCDDGAANIESIDGVACFIYRETLKSHSDLEAKIDTYISTAQSLSAKIGRTEMDIRLHNNLDNDHRRRKPPVMSLAASHSPARYSSARYRDRIVPVYSLTDLLGEEKMRDLFKDTAFEDARAFVVKEGNLTTNAQMALLRLQEYMN
ncbi:hypothetical protein Vi05172_g11541 [Venturia inaequalis]|nr:hypothetical protein EG327_009564 [Venturia inaequalis]RDI78476.1 hypothetical protein Vi05172_g11541 [Venturia inaequalis]